MQTAPVHSATTQREQIPGCVFEALSAVRELDIVEMYDREDVESIVAMLGHGQAAGWIMDHHERYFDALRSLPGTA